MPNDAPINPTTTLISKGIDSITQIGLQAIAGSQQNKALRDEQTFKLNAQKEQNRIESLKSSFALAQDLRNKRFAEQNKKRNAEMDLLNPLNKQTKYLLWASGAVMLIVFVVIIIVLTR